VNKPSNADIRALLMVVVQREGGSIEIGNAELYDAMMPPDGRRAARLGMEETADGVRLTLFLDPDRPA
jgi:hypothetical protein